MPHDDGRHYNYDTFILENFRPHERFDKSPELGKAAPDFPLWQMEDQSQTSLRHQWQDASYLVVEFGSLT
jgi:hypothetical protein